MPALLRRVLGSALLVSATLSVETAPSTDDFQVPAIDDDECAGSDGFDGTCALNALQRKAAAGRVRKHDHAGAAELAGDAELDAAADMSLAELSAQYRGLSLDMDAVNLTLPPEAMVQADAESGSGYSCEFVPYSGPITGAASCFCHKVRNPTCVGKPCTCREGCTGFALAGSESSTFFNKARATCKGAYLTIPRSYFKDLGDAKRKCGGGLFSLLKGMLHQGFLAYQGVQPGPVMQCIHTPGHVSVEWLHLHSFCADGMVDGMPNKATAVCGLMRSYADAGRIAGEMAKFR